MAARVAAELREHRLRSAFTGDDDLVFAHPQTGKPYDASKMRMRFKERSPPPSCGHSASTTCATPTEP